MRNNQTIKTVKFVLKEARPYWRYLAVVLVSMLIYIAADFVHPFIYRSIINTLSQPLVKPEEVFSSLMWLLLLLAASLVVHRLFRDAAGFCLLRAEVKTMAAIANKTFKHVVNLSYDFHTSRFAGSTARKINRGVARIEDLMDVVFYDLTPTVVSMLVSVVVLMGASLTIGVPLAISLMIFVAVTILLVKKRMTFDYQANSHEAKASGIMVDSLTNNLTVKTFTGEQIENRLYRKANKRWAKSAIQAWDWDVWTSIFQGSFVVLLEVAMLAIALSLWRAGKFSVGDVVFVESNMGLLMFPLWTLGRFYRNFRRAEVDLFDVLDLLSIKPSIRFNHKLLSLKVSKGEISFHSVSFAYKDSNKNAINKLSLSIKSGEKIALVGRSGAGKSTFIKLLFRFIKPQTGKIEIDRQDITPVNLTSLRQSISLVPQEPLLFHRSIYDNIAYGRPAAAKDEVIKAAKMAYADEFIKSLPKGYDSLVGERGIKLSGGERQRIALARVFLENAPILVLDEATSSLDSASENLIQMALAELIKNRTTIVIAHRLSTIQKMDRIIVLDHGQIAESGSHDDLMAGKNSLYKFLWESQIKKFLK